MISLPAGSRIWLVAGITDMRNGFNGLASKVQNVLKDDPFSGHLFIFRGRREDMDTSLAHENARLRALLQTQQDTIRQMAKYNRLLSQRVAAYASEINRLKALVAKLQRMQFGKSSEKLRAKTERQIQEAQERISALQEEMAETLGEQYDPVLPSALRQSSV